MSEGRLLLPLPIALLAAALVGCGTQAATDVARDPQACASCHLREFQSAKHHAGERPRTCGVCHAQSAWQPSRLEHPFWELTGAHEKAKCFGCHQGTPPAFKGTKKECVACHRTEYEGAKDHVARFPTTCAECHTTAGWKPTLPEPEGPVPEPSANPLPEPTPSATGTTPKPRPKPRPWPVPTVVPSTPPPPDTVTGPSRRTHR